MPETLDAFVATPDNPAPAGLEWGHLTVQGDRSLRFVIARGPADMVSRGTVVLLQGRNEAAEKYFETIGDLNRLGFTVATFDWRGQGGSGRLSPFASIGHIARLGTFVGDLDVFMREVALSRCPGPYAVLAHSMGGLVALAAMPQLVAQVERMVLTAPLVALSGGPGSLRALGLAAGFFHWVGLGHLPLRRTRRIGPGSTLAGNALTSDGRRFERNRALQAGAPNLFVSGLSASWLRAVLRAARRLERSSTVAAMRLPTLFIVSGNDRVVSTAASERLAWRMRSGHLLHVPGARHELLQEADRFREPVLAAFEGFVASALPLRTETIEAPPVDASALEDALQRP